MPCQIRVAKRANYAIVKATYGSTGLPVCDFMMMPKKTMKTRWLKVIPREVAQMRRMMLVEAIQV